MQPEEDALDKVLGIARINTLEIFLTRPNPDDNDDEAEEVLRELEHQGAMRKHTQYTAIPKGKRTDKKVGIQPNAATRREARVAASNGYVRAAGRDKAGEPQDLSTQKYPKIIPAVMTELHGALAVALRVAKNAIVGRRGQRRD